MRVYVTYAITASKEDYTDVMLAVKGALESLGHQVRVAKPLEDPNQIFELDMDELKSSHLLVAEVSEPSHGVGVEIASSWYNHYPCICLHKKGAKVSRFVRGFPNAIFVEYKNAADVRKRLGDIVKEVMGNK
jgi:hypothetical protein